MHVKARPILGCVVTLTGVALLCFVGLRATVRGCFWWNCAPSRQFTVLDPSLPISLFPKGSIQSPLHQPSELSGAQAAAVSTVHWNEGAGLAVYNVDRFNTDARARKRFSALVGMADFPLEANPDLLHSVADDFVTGCGYTEWGANACMAYARYEEFVLTFVAYIDRDMTIERFRRIAVTIDGAMTQLMTEP